MRSSFFGLHVATSAMNVARAHLHVVGHNIANAETPGFSRQFGVQQATQPLRVAGARGMVGTGSHIISIGQMRNQFLDTKFWNQNAVHGQFVRKSEILSLTQGILRDNEEIGLTHEINNIMNRMQDLNGNAHELTYRANFLSSLDSLSNFLNTTYSQLTQQLRDINQEIRATVGIVNSLGMQIQNLNRQIAVLELDGSNANDMRDQRALLLDELSQHVNIEVREIEKNPEFAAGREIDPRQSRRELMVMIDGAIFVNHFHMHQIEVRQRDPQALLNPEEPGRMYDIFWANGNRFDMYSPTLTGGLSGLIQLRDGNGSNHTRITSHNGASPLLDVSFNANFRTDIAGAGIITARHPDGRIMQIRYTDRTYTGGFPPTGATLTLHPDDLPADWGTVWSLTVGETTDYMGIPYFMSRLNELARTLARAFNEGQHLFGDGTAAGAIAGLNGGHVHGFDLNNNAGQWLMAYEGFNFGSSTATPFDYFNINATNFRINPEIMRNPAFMALSSTPTVSGGESKHDIIEGWTKLTENRSLFREGRLGDFLSSITGDLGIVARQAVRFEASYAEIVVTTDNRRRSVSGVSLDEEGVSMIQHQLVFNAAARLLTVIDEIYDTTINRLGTW
ncbi:MAG: flagellar hook-associated protein FlgK [Defluviitaleaceae bacterium]|nr:flagellar hook-associated protein FlgK [Defluviitaleaceae bacterium]